MLATALAWDLWLFVLRNLPASIASKYAGGTCLWRSVFHGGCWVKSGVVEGCGIVLIVVALAIVSLKNASPGFKAYESTILRKLIG